MGYRPCICIGYGIILTEEQKKKIKNMHLYQRYLKYFNDEHNIINKLYEEKDDLQLEKHNLIYLFLKTNNDRIEYYHNHILSPYDQDTNFFGYVTESYYGKELSYLMYFLMNKEYFISFEHQLPLTNAKKEEWIQKITDKNRKEIYVINQEVISLHGFLEFLKNKDVKRLSEKFNEDKENLLNTIEEYLREHYSSMLGMYCKDALNLINVIYPEIELKDINRYLIGYYS